MILRLIFLFVVIIPFGLIFSLPQFLIVKLGFPGASVLPRIFHTLLCAMLGLRITVSGTPNIGQPTLMVSNHISWIDIAAIGSKFPISFIAKSEVGGWPIIGFLASLHRTILVNRTKRIDSGRTSNEIADRLANGDAIVLFGEGTSGDGTHVQPFRSALLGGVFRALDRGKPSGQQVWVQPMAICYTHLYGMAISRNQRSQVAWVGDAELAPHFLQVIKGGSIDMHIRFGTPIAISADDDRKEIARRAHEQVRQMLLQLNNHPE